MRSALRTEDCENTAAPPLTLDLQDALSGGVDFSSHDWDSFDGVAEVTLEDILSGAGLLEAVLDEDDERPPPPSADDGGWDSSPHDELVDGLAYPPPIPTAEDISASFFGSVEGPQDIFPYPNRGMMKTDILFSSANIRFSRGQKEAILVWGRDMGARDVPSLYGLDKFQKEALCAVGDPTEKVRAASGNVFYMNSIHQALAKDYAHVERRQKMHLYPEFTGNQVTEIWQAAKMLVDAPDDVLTPMVRVRGQDYYVKELVYCADKSWFIPSRFFEFEGALWAKGLPVMESQTGLVVKEEYTAMPCSMFSQPWPEIERRTNAGTLFEPGCAGYSRQMPHPDRLIADGLEIECPPLIVFIDDVSGNSSKQWNVHYSCYVSNAALPRAELEKAGNIRFVATSPHASPMEIIRAICEELRSGRAKPFKVWDAVKQRQVLIRPWILLLPGDNPMQAELCSHIGLKGNHFCRVCHVGGDHAYKTSNEGFATLLSPGRPRTVPETREAVKSQLIMATHAASEKSVKSAITLSGVKDSFAVPVLNQLIAKGKLLRKSTPTRLALSPEAVNKALFEELMQKSSIPLRNPLLDMDGLDVHLDTPVEPLHTHLLGVVKYFWAQTVWTLEKQGRFSEFQARLNSISRTGLKIPNIMADYMCRYRGALIGKHFKTISQVMAFAVCGLVDGTLQNAWLSIGHVTVLIWETNIKDIKSFTQELCKAIHEVVDFAAMLSPGLLTEKNKFHILMHLPEHVQRFGPALLFSTERYESFNHIFRLCSIHSNRQAPSRDIAATFANQERCRHVLSGGYWYDTTKGDWVQAGAGALRLVSNSRADAHLLGLVPEKRPVPGHMSLNPPPPHQPGSPVPRRPYVRWLDTEAARVQPSLPAIDGEWYQAQSVVTKAGDTAGISSEIPTSSPHEQTELVYASVVEILQTTSPGTMQSYVIVRESVLGSHLHKHLNMPTIERSGPLRVVHPKDIICVINVQHDCHFAKCSLSETENRRQERENSTRTRAVIKHSDMTHYVLNTVALHNHAFLQQSLPPHLRAHPTFFTERALLHQRAAECLRDTRLQKKLAREALIRRNAEAALRASVANQLSVDPLGLTSAPAVDVTVVPSVIHDGGSQAAQEPASSTEPLAESASCTQPPAPGQVPTEILLSSLDAVYQPDSGLSNPTVTNAPRGPRQRRAVRRSCNATAAVIAAEHPSWPSDAPRNVPTVTVDPAADLGLDYPIGDPPPPLKRRRARAQADPTAAATREAELHGVNSDLRPQNNKHLQAKYQSSAREKGRKHALSAGQIEEVTAFCELSPIEMLIDIKIHCMRTDNDILKRFMRIFTRHPDFLIRLRHALAAALLAPNIPAYVEGVTTQLTRHLEMNSEVLLGIPNAQRSDPADWALVKSAIAVELTNMRSAMKLKLDASIKNQQDIYELTTALMIYDMKAKKEHWGRFAFLRQCTLVYDRMPAKKRGDFWKHIDNSLREVRKSAAEEHPTNMVSRKLHQSMFLAHLLELDINKFTLKSGSLSRAVYKNDALTELQYSTEKLVSTFTVDDSPVGVNAQSAAAEPTDERE
ncbi:hypothetical protein BD414DRAFT_404535 [Trametes punicea]|nr:hypothetical protein BD414DRAFT_404535 [Trametes punicea]